MILEGQSQKILLLHNMMREYLVWKGYSVERIEEILKESSPLGISASQKLVLQQMIRERAKQDENDIDRFITEERKKSGIELSGQVLGVLSKVESSYIKILLEEQQEN